MKRRRLIQVTLIALLLVMPFVLSGCYVSPNDIEASKSAGDSLNFPVYQPETQVPTSPPATDAPIAVDPNPVSGAATPGSGMVQLATPNISSWTTIAPVISTQTPGPGSTSSAGTQVSSPAPTATPQTSLKVGSKGEEVKTVQQKLKDLGFLRGSADGVFGVATENAVKAFQKQYGLTADGKVGPATLAKLISAKATARPTSSPTPRATATPSYNDNTYLRKGNSGSQVRQMQQRLISLGYLAGTATGNFDTATEYAVMAFQRRNTSYTDGVAGPATLKALYSSSARSTSTASGIIGVSLRSGSEGAAVRALQTRLKALGYYSGTVDGSFGEGTVTAVKNFQRGHNLTADGVAGGGTINKLFSSDAKTYAQTRATATPKPRPTVTPRLTPTPLPPNVYVNVTAAPYGQYATLRRGMYGTPVEDMQRRLQAQGYFTGSIDGYFGEGTENAVKAFQRVNGLYTDGVAGPATLRVLIEGAFPEGS